METTAGENDAAEQPTTSCGLRLFPLTRLQIGPKRTRRSLLYLHVAHEQEQLVLFVDHEPWASARPSWRKSVLQLIKTKKPFSSPFSNASEAESLLRRVIQVEEEEYRKVAGASHRSPAGTPSGKGALERSWSAAAHRGSFPRQDSHGGRRDSDAGTANDVESKTGAENKAGAEMGGLSRVRRLRAKWRSVLATLRRLRARRRALKRIRLPPDGFCGCVTFQVKWSDVRGIAFRNELQLEAWMAIEASAIWKKEFASLQEAVDYHLSLQDIVDHHDQSHLRHQMRPALPEALEARESGTLNQSEESGPSGEACEKERLEVKESRAKGRLVEARKGQISNDSNLSRSGRSGGGKCRGSEDKVEENCRGIVKATFKTRGIRLKTRGIRLRRFKLRRPAVIAKEGRQRGGKPETLTGQFSEASDRSLQDELRPRQRHLLDVSQDLGLGPKTTFSDGDSFGEMAEAPKSEISFPGGASWMDSPHKPSPRKRLIFLSPEPSPSRPDQFSPTPTTPASGPTLHSGASSRNPDNKLHLATPQSIPYKFVFFRFADPLLPPELSRAITPNPRLLRMLEAGLPGWAIFFQSCPGLHRLYRPWMRPLVLVATLAVSLATFLIGFYDLYKNVPLLRQALSRLLGPAFEWIATADVLTRLRYVGTILFVQNAQKLLRSLGVALSSSYKILRYFLAPLAGPLQQLVSVFEPLAAVATGSLVFFFRALASAAVGVSTSFAFVGSFVLQLATAVLHPAYSCCLFVMSSVLAAITLVTSVCMSLLHPVLSVITYGMNLLTDYIHLFGNVLLKLAEYLLSPLYTIVAVLQASVAAFLSSKGQVQSISSSAKKLKPTPSMVQLLWNEVLKKVLRSLSNVLRGFAKFCDACRRHKRSAYNYLLGLLHALGSVWTKLCPVSPFGETKSFQRRIKRAPSFRVGQAKMARRKKASKLAKKPT